MNTEPQNIFIIFQTWSSLSTGCRHIMLKVHLVWVARQSTQ